MKKFVIFAFAAMTVVTPASAERLLVAEAVSIPWSSFSEQGLSGGKLYNFLSGPVPCGKDQFCFYTGRTLFRVDAHGGTVTALKFGWKGPDVGGVGFDEEKIEFLSVSDDGKLLAMSPNGKLRREDLSEDEKAQLKARKARKGVILRKRTAQRSGIASGAVKIKLVEGQKKNFSYVLTGSKCQSQGPLITFEKAPLICGALGEPRNGSYLFQCSPFRSMPDVWERRPQRLIQWDEGNCRARVFEIPSTEDPYGDARILRLRDGRLLISIFDRVGVKLWTIGDKE